MALLQKDRLISLSTPLGKDALLVETLEGTEGVSRLFRFQLVLASEKASIPLNALVGQNVTVAFELTGGKAFRYLNGFVSRFAQGDVDTRVAHYYAEVVPWLWFLTRTADCRIFQRKNVPDILQQIFKDLGFTDFKLRLQGTFEPREYCVQYRETDFNFVSRLMEEEGIFYFFEHADGKHTLVLANDPGVHQPCPNQAQARYDYLSGGKQDVDVVTRWHIEQELQPGKTTLRDYYFETPSNNLQVSTPTGFSVNGNGKYEIYDYPGYFAKRFDGDDKAGKVRPDGERTSKLGQQGEDAFHKVVTGAGSCRAFVPGYSFTLTEHRRPELNGPYVLTQVSHSATNNLGYGEGATYDNTFTCIPLAVPFRPARTTPKPVVHGAQTAVVVGLKGQEIDTDKYGRVKVQFHWDREGKNDQDSSCWIRVGTPWAGKGWGLIHIPRIGQEVIVHFLEGDPDQPLIIGSVYNAEQMPAYPLPDEKTKSYLKSNTSPGGVGFNEIRLEDKKGKEQIFLHAERNLDTRVKNDSMERVIANRHLIVGYEKDGNKGGDQNEKVYQDKNLHILRNQVEQIEGNLQLTVGKGQADNGGNVDILIEKNKTETVEKSSHLHVKEAAYEKVDKNVAVTVGGDHVESVGGKYDLSVTGARSEKVGADQSLTVAGSQQEKVGQKHAVEAGQEIHLKAGMKVILEAGAQLTLKGPGGFVDIGPSGVTIQGTMVLINSGGSAGSGSGSSPTSPGTPEAPQDAQQATPADPAVADDSKTGHKSAPA